MATICVPKNKLWSINVEQFRWNKWVFVNRVEIDIERETDTCFVIQVDLHEGENIFRLKLLDHGKTISVCAPVTMTIIPTSSRVEPANSYGQADTIHMPDMSMWELYDHYGNLVWRGNSRLIPIRGLEEGNYYFCYDNVIIEISVYHEEHRAPK